MLLKAKIRLKKYIFISPSVLLAGIFFLAATPCLSAPVEGDAFVTSSISEPSNLIPFLASDSASHAVTALIFNGLVKYDENLKLVGDLAERWEIQDGGMRILFYLRKSVRWQDGEPFTAEDVKFTYQKLTDPATPTPYGGDFEKVKSLTVVDPYTIEVIYKETFSPGLASWSMGIVPKHLLEKENLLKTDFTRHPIGTGPYRLKKWTTGQSLELWANPDYFEGKPPIKRYIYRVIPDQTTSFLELSVGNIDMAALTPLQYQRQTDTSFFKKNYQKFRYPSFGYCYLGYNLKHPFFSDQRVRKALGLAVNKKEIIEASLLGLGKVSTGPFLPGTWAYNLDVPESVFDPAAARALLKEAGFIALGQDGILSRDGKKFSFTVLTNQGNDQRKMACEIIQKRLRDVGVQMDIRTVEWGTFLKEFIDKKNFDAVMLAWQLSYDPDIYDIFHSSKTKQGEFNFIGYQNPEVDKLLDQGRKEFDEAARAKIYHRIHQILSEDEPYLFLYVPEALPVVHRRFQGVRQAPKGVGFNFIHWYVPKDEQKYQVGNE